MENQNKANLLISPDLFGQVALLINSADQDCLFIDVLESLKNNNINVSIIDIINLDKNFLNTIASNLKDFSRVFIAITPKHKLYCGYIQCLLDILCLDYTGSSMLAALLSEDTVKSKKIWQTYGISSAPFVRWKSSIDWEEIVNLIGFPLAIKSAYSNDNRIFKVSHMEQLSKVFQNFKNLNEILIEPWIAGEEYIVYIIENQALLPLKISDNFMIKSQYGHTQHQQYIKSLNNNAREYANKYNNMQKLALDAFVAIGCSGFAGVKIIKDLNGDCWVLSINIAPALSLNSNFAMAAYNSGITFDALVRKILATSFIKKSCHGLAFISD